MIGSRVDRVHGEGEPSVRQISQLDAAELAVADIVEIVMHRVVLHVECVVPQDRKRQGAIARAHPRSQPENDVGLAMSARHEDVVVEAARQRQRWGQVIPGRLGSTGGLLRPAVNAASAAPPGAMARL